MELPPTFRDDCAAAFFEFIGTVLFLLLGLGGIQAAGTEGTVGTPASTVESVLYISTAMGLSLLVSAWLFFRATGGHFNPNVSLALFLVGVIGPVRFVLYCIAQLVGAIAAAGLVLALTPGSLKSNTTLQNGINNAQGVFIEMFITAALVLAVLMLAVEKHQATPFAPVGMGLTLFATHLFAVYYTGAAVNTARAFGPAAVTGFPFTDQWVYWLGPCLGSFLGAGIYSLLKHFNYLRLTPEQGENEIRPRPVQAVRTLITGRGSTTSGPNTTQGRSSTAYAGSEGEKATRANDSPV